MRVHTFVVAVALLTSTIIWLVVISLVLRGY
jgi:hypothetical protein